MEKVIKIIDELKHNKLIGEFAIAGGIATIFYVEPILTYDLDIFFIMPEGNKGIVTLSPIYNYLKRKGYSADKEHIVIEGLPVQLIPVYNELVKEAVENAKIVKYKNVKTKIIRAEHLIAIMIQTSRPKDKERIIKLMDEAKIDRKYLNKILVGHKLSERFKHFIELFYEK